ncbi:hypothetical protein L873DRAFT_840983 [Choiromyces venosus 120613-1]|uniref:Uncharacterized protein n=1 Tax=Choiromyces venosus 120613-1 TaxID=1336337 RepID=A0A3N4JSE6_9PEZI|nr:hypothetical protein L873DRAFT_840983 [Choiromyces venosus 120613-1]
MPVGGLYLDARKYALTCDAICRLERGHWFSLVFQFFYFIFILVTELYLYHSLFSCDSGGQTGRDSSMGTVREGSRLYVTV